MVYSSTAPVHHVSSLKPGVANRRELLREDLRREIRSLSVSSKVGRATVGDGAGHAVLQAAA